jgi:transglutaminase-like putative cysteine protease
MVHLLTAAVWAEPADQWSGTARYRFEYRVGFTGVDNGKESMLRVWVPYPAETRHQRVLSGSIEFPWPHRLGVDAAGNRVLYMEGKGLPGSDLVMRFLVERDPSKGLPASEAKAGTPLDPKRYLKATRLVPLEGTIGEIAKRESEGVTSDGEKVRAFYDYVVRTMQYDKAGTGWGRGDAIWACDNQRGNCTDFHSLFMGMARSQGIPVRFIIGFPIGADRNAGSIDGYHCWVEYYEGGRGWVPLDASAAKKSGDHDAYFGTIPNDRVEFTVGRDLTLTPPQSGEPLNFLIYPYAEADGQVVPPEQLRTSFRFERHPR